MHTKAHWRNPKWKSLNSMPAIHLKSKIHLLQVISVHLTIIVSNQCHVISQDWLPESLLQIFFFSSEYELVDANFFTRKNKLTTKVTYSDKLFILDKTYFIDTIPVFIFCFRISSTPLICQIMKSGRLTVSHYWDGWSVCSSTTTELCKWIISLGW